MRWNVERHKPTTLQANRSDKSLTSINARTERAFGTHGLEFSYHAMNFRASFSSSASARSLFKRAFSSLRDLSSLTSCLVMPPHFLRQAYKLVVETFSCRALSWVSWPSALSSSAWRSLSMICSGCVWGVLHSWCLAVLPRGLVCQTLENSGRIQWAPTRI